MRSTSTDVLDRVFDNTCESTGEAKSSSTSFGVDAIIESIPIGLTLDASDNTTKVRNFCKNYKSQRAYHTTSESISTQAIQRAYDSFDECIRLSNTGVTVYHSLYPQLLKIQIITAPGQTINVLGLTKTSGVQCSAFDRNAHKLNFERNEKLPVSGAGSIECTRASSAGPGGAEDLKESVVSLSLDNVRSYTAYWPPVRSLPLADASAISQKLDAIATRVASLPEEIRTRLIRVGEFGVNKEQDASNCNGRHDDYLLSISPPLPSGQKYKVYFSQSSFNAYRPALANYSINTVTGSEEPSRFVARLSYSGGGSCPESRTFTYFVVPIQ